LQFYDFEFNICYTHIANFSLNDVFEQRLPKVLSHDLFEPLFIKIQLLLEK